MTKTGRNDPCPCGSGKKYKHCCLRNDEAAASAALAELAAARAAQDSHRHHNHVGCDFCDHEEDELTHDSNAVIDLIKAGKLDQAETAARELLMRYPEVHDGYDRLGMVYEARGDHKQAADCYRQVINFVRSHPDQYEPQFADTFQRLVQKLDPATPAG
jgi:tetratricopeptide (TPR) repeat protein